MKINNKVAKLGDFLYNGNNIENHPILLNNKNDIEEFIKKRYRRNKKKDI